MKQSRLVACGAAWVAVLFTALVTALVTALPARAQTVPPVAEPAPAGPPPNAPAGSPPGRDVPAPPPGYALAEPHQYEVGVLAGWARQRSAGTHYSATANAKADLSQVKSVIEVDQAPATQEIDVALDVLTRMVTGKYGNWMVGGTLGIAFGSLWALRADVVTEFHAVMGKARVGIGARAGVELFRGNVGTVGGADGDERLTTPDEVNHPRGSTLYLQGLSAGWAPFLRLSYDISAGSGLAVRAGYRLFSTAEDFSLHVEHTDSEGKDVTSKLPADGFDRRPVPIETDGPFVDVVWFAF